ncbi:ATP-binding protein [Patescibacteria group bacterium]|nr:ATP-binding protein [Patescibacteria group bacterium]MBU1349894.1 ATP-binding protein [Patescibacteria group bacterium]MBU1421200.1 ATP-binding protein [Patescibacteria group bacterium]MBU1684367.1 ATP-binding protein [Patescibacteria group bacterium]MBU1778037.1 ATP-binding protein [Patescibacteria group bacterium]
MIKHRYLQKFVTSDLKNKMVFIGGPRQVGKTTLSQYIGDRVYKKHSYLNWDSREDRKMILQGKFRAESKLVIFDEIYKYKQWKNYIKGEFDKYKNQFNILVTGSARLDLYKKGGDSLMGRYHYYRLHPFSLSEVLGIEPKIQIFKDLFFNHTKKNYKIFTDLLVFGGFPEPFIKKDHKTLRRFHNERMDRLVKEDIRDIEQVRDLSALQVLVEILPSRVASLLSLNGLREDLQVAHKTISSWVDILERFYYIFRIYPFSVKIIKSLCKEPKMYLWDWSQIEDKAAKLENIIASHLLKTVHFLYDTQGHKAELHFLRDIEGREIDFLITVNKKPWIAIEVKLSDQQPSKHLKYFAKKLKIPFVFQVIKDTGIDFFQDNIRVISADKFLSGVV